MGQFEHYGIQPVGEIGLPKRGNRASFERVENKPKPKPKTAAAGSPPPPPPKNPPKGPKNPKDNDNENKKSKSLGGLTKGMSSKNNQKMSSKETMDNIRGKK